MAARITQFDLIKNPHADEVINVSEKLNEGKLRWYCHVHVKSERSRAQTSIEVGAAVGQGEGVISRRDGKTISGKTGAPQHAKNHSRSRQSIVAGNPK